MGAVKGMQQKFVFQGVHMLFSGDFAETEWEAGEKRENCFVFIGKNIDKKELTKGFMDCVVTEPLRFQVGDEVQAFVDVGWVNGKVCVTWDSGDTEGNPYRITLDNGLDVWGPVDDDRFVRARIDGEDDV